MTEAITRVGAGVQVAFGLIVFLVCFQLLQQHEEAAEEDVYYRHRNAIDDVDIRSLVGIRSADGMPLFMS